MKFLVTMNMPGNTGRLTHQVICEYPVDTIDGLIEALSTQDFLVVDEYYRDPQSHKLFSAGELGLNYRYVGKVKVYDPNHAKTASGNV